MNNFSQGRVVQRPLSPVMLYNLLNENSGLSDAKINDLARLNLPGCCALADLPAGGMSCCTQACCCPARPRPNTAFPLVSWVTGGLEAQGGRGA